MVKKEVRNMCFEILERKLKTMGYEGSKKDYYHFTKKNKQGFDGVFFTTVDYSAIKEYKIEIFLQIRNDSVQKLINMSEDIDESLKAKQVTCIINHGTFIGNPNLQYIIHTPEDIENAVESFWKIFLDNGIEHMQKCYDINFLNTLYPRYRWMCKKWFTISNWFVAAPTVAFLADKINFAKFRKEFITYLVSDLKFSDDTLNDLNKYLDTISSLS